MLTRMLLGLLLIGAGSPLLSQEEFRIEKRETPDEVIRWVATDLLTLPEEDRPFMRYLWSPSWGHPDTPVVATYTMNLVVSRSGRIQLPVLVAGGHVQRWDFRELVPKKGVTEKVLLEWDSLQVREPYFHDIYAFAPSEEQPFPPIGLTVVDSMRPLLEAGYGGEVVAGNIVPVYRSDWLIAQALSSVDGGAYLRLRGIEEIRDGSITLGEGSTQESTLLSRFGIFEESSVVRDGDRRVGMFRSEVTGKPRSVVVLDGLLGRAWITDDLFDEDVTEQRHPIYNLLDQQYRGREIIVEMSNGLHLFLITDDKGNILDEAPPQLATDHRVPPPYTRRLQGGAISCIRCHASESGLRTCKNDVATLLSGPLSVIDDPVVVDDIETRYSGRRFDRLIERGREDYDFAVDALSGGQFDSQTMGDATTAVFAQWRYDMIDTKRALMELGILIEEDVRSTDVFKSLIQFRDIDSQVVEGITLEDPTIAALYVDIPVLRADFDRVYSILLERSLKWRSGK